MTRQDNADAARLTELSASINTQRAERAALISRLIARGWTQQQIAAAARCTQAAISKTHGGRRGGAISWIAGAAARTWCPDLDGSGLEDHIRDLIDRMEDVVGTNSSGREIRYPNPLDTRSAEDVAEVLAYAEELLKK
jgi:hypothetical protein